MGRSDFTDVFIKKLVYIRFYTLVTSYDLAPGAARDLKGYRRYGSRKVWDIHSPTDFIRPRIATNFFLVKAIHLAVILTRFGLKCILLSRDMAKNVFFHCFTSRLAAGHSWSQLVTPGHIWSHLVTC